jgi:hypothetical protein
MRKYYCRLCKKTKEECGCGHILGYTLIENDEDMRIFEANYSKDIKEQVKKRESQVFILLGEINKIKFFAK